MPMMHWSANAFTNRLMDKEEAFNMILEGECGVFNPRLIEIFRMIRMELEEILEKTESSNIY